MIYNKYILNEDENDSEDGFVNNIESEINS